MSASAVRNQVCSWKQVKRPSDRRVRVRSAVWHVYLKLYVRDVAGNVAAEQMCPRSQSPQPLHFPVSGRRSVRFAYPKEVPRPSWPHQRAETLTTLSLKFHGNVLGSDAGGPIQLANVRIVLAIRSADGTSRGTIAVTGAVLWALTGGVPSVRWGHALSSETATLLPTDVTQHWGTLKTIIRFPSAAILSNY